jgi:hypothetical protein
MRCEEGGKAKRKSLVERAKKQRILVGLRESAVAQFRKVTVLFPHETIASPLPVNWRAHISYIYSNESINECIHVYL